MQNKYTNTIFYSFIIIFMILLSIGTILRFRSDMYFDISRRTVYSYAIRNENKELMQWAYNKAVEINPLERANYSNILNKDYYKIIQTSIKTENINRR